MSNIDKLEAGLGKSFGYLDETELPTPDFYALFSVHVPEAKVAEAEGDARPFKTEQ